MYKIINDDILNVNLVSGITNFKYSKDNNNKEYKDLKFQNFIYTDGDISVTNEYIIDNINSLPNGLTIDDLKKIINVCELDSDIDEIILKKIKIENATYYIDVEWKKMVDFTKGVFYGYFWHINNIKVCLITPIKRDTRKKIKITLKMIYQNQFNNNGLYKVDIGQLETKKINYSETVDKVYKLKK